MEAGLTTGAATGVLNRLKKAGYVHRRADPQDQTTSRPDVSPPHTAAPQRRPSPARTLFQGQVARPAQRRQRVEVAQGMVHGCRALATASKQSNTAGDRRLAKPAIPRIIDDPPPLPAHTSKGIVKTATFGPRTRSSGCPAHRPGSLRPMRRDHGCVTCPSDQFPAWTVDHRPAAGIRATFPEALHLSLYVSSAVLKGTGNLGCTDRLTSCLALVVPLGTRAPLRRRSSPHTWSPIREPPRERNSGREDPPPVAGRPIRPCAHPRHLGRNGKRGRCFQSVRVLAREGLRPGSPRGVPVPRATHRPYDTCRHRVLAPGPRKRRAGVQRCPCRTLHAAVARRATKPRRRIPAGLRCLTRSVSIQHR